MINIFYNNKNLKDTMVVSISTKQVTKTENFDTYTALYNNDDIIGFNIFNISKYAKINPGFIYATQEILDLIFKITGINLSKHNEKNFIVGKIKNLQKVENTHLNYCDIEVEAGKEIKIICGAKNVELNKNVVVAMLNTSMPNGMMIVKSKIQGHESNGMLCSSKELNIEWPENKEGIILLDDTYKVGDLFKPVFSNLRQ